MLAEKALKCKAAETHGLLRFAVMTLEKYHTILQRCEQSHMFDLLLRAGRAAEAFDHIMAQYSRKIPEDACDELHAKYHRFIQLCCRAGVPVLPKSHLMQHLVAQARQKGNPRTFSTYVDESYNGAIAKVCRSVHRRNWAMAVYRKLEMLEALLEAESLSCSWKGLLRILETGFLALLKCSTQPLHAFFEKTVLVIHTPRP